MSKLKKDLLNLGFTTDGIIKDEELEYESFFFEANGMYIGVCINYTNKTIIHTINDREFNRTLSGEELITLVNILKK